MTSTLSQSKSTAASPAQRALSTAPNSGRAWWFLGTLAVLRNPEGAPRTPTVIELTIPPGGSPPRHIHDALDDSFLMLDGEVIIRCGDRTFLAHPNDYVVLPAGVEHTFRVTSAQAARMLLVHATDEFLNFIEAVGSPAAKLELPATDHGINRDSLIRIAAEHELRIVGAPLEQSDVAGGAVS